LIADADINNELLCLNSDDEKTATYFFVSQKCTGTTDTHLLL